MGKTNAKELEKVENFLKNLQRNVGEPVVISLLVQEEKIYFQSAITKSNWDQESSSDETEEDSGKLKPLDVDKLEMAKKPFQDYFG